MNTAGSAASGMGFEDGAELYALPLTQFTTRRDELARRARTGGDRGLADRIKALRRPTVVAWLANRLVREQPADIQALLRLGEELREATAQLEGPQLRLLAQQQRAMVAALVAHAAAIAAATGQQVSAEAERGLHDTLQAALADPDAAAALAGGRLTTGMHPPAFGGLITTATAAPLPGSAADRAPQAPAADDAAERVDQARADLAAAEAAAAEARSAVREATEEAEREDARARQTVEQVAALEEQLKVAEDAQTQAARAARDALATLDRARNRARDAEQRLGQARARLATLDTSGADRDGGQ